MQYSMLHDDTSSYLFFTVTGTIFVIILLIAFFAQRRKVRPNWYEKNLIEIAESPPQYVRCKALQRNDTDEDGTILGKNNNETSTDLKKFSENRKQSRIHEIKRQCLEVTTLPIGDLTQIFTVPKMTKSTNSMFKNFDQSQIDRGLYQTSMDSESNYNEESCGCCGSIKLSLFMDPNLNLLTVVLKQAMDLVAKRQDGYPNPYFKISLDIPDNVLPKIEQQTKIAKNTSSPCIAEEFFFQIPSGNASQCRLEILVFDYDQFSVDECIGYCWLTLGRLSLSTNKQQSTVFWAEVLPFDDDNGHGFGEVLFSITYLSKAQRLTINMFKARNLKTDASDNLSSIAIRITLLTSSEKRLKRKKTSSKRNTRNPQFNESLSFSIPKNSLCDTILEVEVVYEYGTFGIACKAVGKLELPLHKCRDLWRAIIREEKSQARWYTFEEP